jgi:NitT/TauT family transport system substrate-binding protein
VIADSVDVGIAAGAMSDFAKGARVRVTGAETTGASDLYWYVKAARPSKPAKISKARRPPIHQWLVDLSSVL